MALCCSLLECIIQKTVEKVLGVQQVIEVQINEVAHEITIRVLPVPNITADAFGTSIKTKISEDLHECIPEDTITIVMN